MRLCFGTGHFNARMGAGDAASLIHAALDAGITHIDTARLYGDGVAEGYIGAAIAGRRDQVFLVSKAGIIPPVNGFVRRGMNKLLKTGRSLPGGRSLLPEPAWNEPVFGAFGIDELRTSLEASLRALQTDHLDLFLLHEVSAPHLASGEVLTALQDWQREGLFADFGIASPPQQTRDILAAGHVFSHFQTAASVFDSHADEFQGADHRLLTHSWLGPVLARFQSAFAGDQALADKAARVLYIDVRKPGELAACLLRHALMSNPGGRVLFSTRSPARLAEMARAAQADPLTPGQLEALACVTRCVLERAPA